MFLVTQPESESLLFLPLTAAKQSAVSTDGTRQKSGRRSAGTACAPFLPEIVTKLQRRVPTKVSKGPRPVKVVSPLLRLLWLDIERAETQAQQPTPTSDLPPR